MSIDLLDNRFLNTLIDHLWEEWSEDYIMLTPYKTKKLLKEFYESTNKSEIPTTYIIFKDNVLIGTCLIDNEDMLVHPELKPWLASVYILPEFRNQGYGEKLIKYVIQKYPILHLWTFNQKLANYYKKFGFIQKEIIAKHFNHENIIFMANYF